MDEASIQQIEPVASTLNRRQPEQPAAPAPRNDVRIEPVAAQPAPQPEPQVARVAEPVIHDAPRNLEPIVDPWVEEFETNNRGAAAQHEQGDLYAEREPRRPEPKPQREEPREKY